MIERELKICCTRSTWFNDDKIFLESVTECVVQLMGRNEARYHHGYQYTVLGIIKYSLEIFIQQRFWFAHEDKKIRRVLNSRKSWISKLL